MCWSSLQVTQPFSRLIVDHIERRVRRLKPLRRETSSPKGCTTRRLILKSASVIVFNIRCAVKWVFDRCKLLFKYHISGVTRCSHGRIAGWSMYMFSVINFRRSLSGLPRRQTIYALNSISSTTTKGPLL